MTPILSFFPCAEVSDASERPATSVATISQHTKRTDRYGNMGSSPESVGRPPLCAGIRSCSSDNVKRMDGGKWYVRNREPRGDHSTAISARKAGRALLTEWKLLVDGENPIARTNVAPLVGAPSEPSLYAFAYTIRARRHGPRSSWPARA